MDSKMNVTIDLVKGTTDLKKNEVDTMFTFGAQNQMVNEFLAKQSANEGKKMASIKGGGAKYRPFEATEDEPNGESLV